MSPKSEVFLMDNLEGMRKYPDGYFELAIVDPPYGIGASKGTWGSSNLGKVTNYGEKNWDEEKPKPEFYQSINRVSRNQVIWGANHLGNMPPSSCWIVWDKLNSADFADCELAWTSFNSAVRKFEFRWNGMLQGNMSQKEKRIHPTQKPVALYKWLLKNYAKPGDKILDTHGGSMSSVIASLDMGFQITCFEKDPDYARDAKTRILNYLQQQKLFAQHGEIEFHY